MKGNWSVLMVLLAAMLWGTTGTAQSFAPASAHPVAFGAMRLAIGGLTLLLFISIQKKSSFTFRDWPLRFVFLAALCMAFYQPFFFSAVSVTGIAVGTVVAIGSAPVLAGVMEWVVYRRIPSRNWWIATTLAISGCVLLFLYSGSVQLNPLGVLLALGAGASFAGYTLVSKTLLASHPPDMVVAVVFTLSAVMLSPLLFFYDLSWLLEGNGIGTSLYLGVIATALAYLLFARGLHRINASTAVTLSLAEPLTAALLGVFLVGEALTFASWIGIILLFSALAVLSFTKRKPINEKAAIRT
ncbi:EamA family transporter [Jeotgalibacillus proteolyticus]|uniref:EamA family transporter n=1 Tax=Jeotgalibacillus proteolyticus TaxID=2082395 RepID=A0A2S5GCF7_9BACL|nr:EamA family transporter [Jeotgalibacillus proteolyticus]PPA70727.1 EamA family transporter [Jeotgalibacillus proteolyticus]